MTRIKMHISKVKLPFYPPCEVKCRLQNWVSTLPPLKEGRSTLKKCGLECSGVSSHGVALRHLGSPGCLWSTRQSSSSCVLDVCFERKRAVGVIVYKFFMMFWFLWCSMFRWHWKVLFMCVLIFFFFFWLWGCCCLWPTLEALRQWGMYSERKRIVGVIILSLMKWLVCTWCDFLLTMGPSNVCLFTKMSP